MNRIIKLIILVLTFTFCFTLIACNKEDEKSKINQEQVDYVIQYIDELPEVMSLKYEEDVLYAKELYEGLNAEEKALITNYEKVLNHIGKLDYLKVEDSYILNAMEDVKSELKKSIPTKIEADVFEITLPTKQNYSNEYKSYTFDIKWTSSDNKTINSTSGTVYHDLNEVTVTLTAVISCLDITDTVTFTRNVLVEDAVMRDLSKEKVVGAYFFGSYVEFTELDLETINVVYYCFADICKKTSGGTSEYYVSVSGLPLITRLQELRKEGIRLVFSIGGWHDDSAYWDTYSEAAANETYRKQVAQSILQICQTYHLDGVDMDWEYPTKDDKNNYTLLMKEISETLKAVNKNYIITAAIPCDTWANNRYDFASLNKFMDYINVMGYDMELQNKTSHHCSLAQLKKGVEAFKGYGLSYEKMVIGGAFYGKVYSNIDSKNNGLDQTGTVSDNLTFTEIKSNYLSKLGTTVTRYYDAASGAYYLYDSANKEFVTYDDPDAFTAKCEYAIEKNMAGIMFWSFNEDTTDTLMTAIANAIK